MCIRDRERLKDLRVERGLTLGQLAEQTGLSKSAPVSYTHLYRDQDFIAAVGEIPV